MYDRIDRPILLSSSDLPVVAALRGLRRLTMLAPVVFVAAVEIGIHIGLGDRLSRRMEVATTIAVIVVGGVVFAVVIADILRRIQSRLTQRNRQLAAVHSAGISLASEMTLEPLLLRFVDLAREITNAQYGALGIVADDDRLEQFITSGITEEERGAIGDPPKGTGLLADISKDSRSAGFPPNHPPMKTLLGVPVVYKDKIVGRLYLSEKQGGQEFTSEDEEMVRLFAAQAAASLENARLLQRSQDLAILEERERIGMDLHDGVIQSLYGVGLNLEDCADVLAEDPEFVRQRLDKAVNDLNQVIKDIRSYIFHLRPAAFDSRDLGQALFDLAREVRVNSLIEVNLDVAEDGVRDLRPDVSENLFHIAQEALANVAKHSRATQAWTRLQVADGVVQLTVRDNGRGFNASRPGGVGHRGLGNIADRARALGGSYEVTSSIGGGTSITVAVPLEGAYAHA
jgi:signal transduction histidine kinase